MLPDESVQQFRHDGYVVARGLFDDDEGVQNFGVSGDIAGPKFDRDFGAFDQPGVDEEEKWRREGELEPAIRTGGVLGPHVQPDRIDPLVVGRLNGAPEGIGRMQGIPLELDRQIGGPGAWAIFATRQGTRGQQRGEGYLPVNWAGRFSRNADNPSLVS